MSRSPAHANTRSCRARRSTNTRLPAPSVLRRAQDERGVLQEQSGARGRAVGAEEESGGRHHRRDRLRQELQVGSRRRGRRSLCLDARGELGEDAAGAVRARLLVAGEVVVQERRAEQDEGVYSSAAVRCIGLLARRAVGSAGASPPSILGSNARRSVKERTSRRVERVAELKVASEVAELGRSMMRAP